jgi:hypothetical protein
MADLGEVRENLRLLARGASMDRREEPPALADVKAQVRRLVDEVFAATFLAIEALPAGPPSQPLLEALTGLADASAPVAAALMRPVPDPTEALRWWPEYEAAFQAAAQAVFHDKPLTQDTFTW